MLDSNPLKRLLTALSYRLGATLAAGAVAVPLEPMSGMGISHNRHMPEVRWTCPGFVEGLGVGIRVSCLTSFCPPVWWHSFVRPPAEPFFHPGPHENAAVARSGGQGRPHFGAARRACPCMRLSKSSAYLTHSPLPSFQFLCSTWNPVSSPRPARDGGRRAQGRSRSAVALPWPHARWFPGRTLIAPSTAARWLWSG